MNKIRRKVLTKITLIIFLTGIVFYMSIVFRSNKPIDYARKNQFRVVPIDNLLVDKPKLFGRDELPVFIYISSATGDPVLLETSVKYDDSEYYRLIRYRPGVYSNGNKYAFVEEGKGGWFSLDGTMVSNPGWYTGRIKPVSYEVRMGNLYFVR
ncbi:hypothetical protein ACJJI4_04770 [Microbulbifer sp. TRSA002]|uniref:hypothetical protein n=1 Tax=Microbulbifer sp. TRSA002 TaxID=3243382 RepID=UPI0040396875